MTRRHDWYVNKKDPRGPRVLPPNAKHRRVKKQEKIREAALASDCRMTLGWPMDRRIALVRRGSVSARMEGRVH